MFTTLLISHGELLTLFADKLIFQDFRDFLVHRYLDAFAKLETTTRANETCEGRPRALE